MWVLWSSLCRPISYISCDTSVSLLEPVAFSPPSAFVPSGPSSYHLGPLTWQETPWAGFILKYHQCDALRCWSHTPIEVCWWGMHFLSNRSTLLFRTSHCSFLKSDGGPSALWSFNCELAKSSMRTPFNSLTWKGTVAHNTIFTEKLSSQNAFPISHSILIFDLGEGPL